MALKEASETRYWIDITIQSETISEKKFSSMIDEINK
ncbi:four helix bundle protein [Pleurocapsa sp. PCC 7319]